MRENIVLIRKGSAFVLTALVLFARITGVVKKKIGFFYGEGGGI
jgi:hypothetical protein